MKIDERKLPAILVCVVAVILLAIAFYTNFIPANEIIVEDVIETNANGLTHGRESNILYDDIDNETLTVVRKSYNTAIDKKGTNRKSVKSGTPSKIKGSTSNFNTPSSCVSESSFSETKDDENSYPGCLIIVEKANLSNDLKNGVLIQLVNDTIYTVNMPSNDNPGMTINFWNSSNFAKNIRTNSSFISEGIEKGKFFTLKSQRVLTLQSNGKSWIVINDSDITNNKEIIQKYISNQIDNIIQLNKLTIDGVVQSVEKRFIDQFNDDRNTYDSIITSKFRDLEHQINSKITSIDLSCIEKRIYDRLEYKIENGINPHNDDSHMINIIHEELNKIKSEIEGVKSSLKKEILEFMYTDNNELKSKVTNLIKMNKDEIINEIKLNIEDTISQQISIILSKLDTKIASIFDGRIRDYIIQIKDTFNSIISTKLELYTQTVNNKIEIIFNKLSVIESALYTTINNHVLELQENFQYQITNMKDNIIKIMDLKIETVQKKLSLINGDLSSRINSLKSEVNEQLQANKDAINSQISSQISEISSRLQTQLKSISTEIISDIQTQQEYIQSQITEQQQYIESQIEELQSQLDSQKTYIQSQIQLAKSTAETNSTSVYNQLVEFQSQLAVISSEVSQLQSDMSNGRVTFNNISAKNVLISSYLNSYIYMSAGTTGQTNISTDDSQNTFFGTDYGMNNNSAYSSNVGIGANAFSYLTMTSGYNTGVGANILRNSTGDYNTAVGYSISQFSGSNNSMIGYQAGYALSGDYNTYMGYIAGQWANGSYNTLLGANTTCGNNSKGTGPYNYSTAIGSNAAISQSNQIVLGGSNNGTLPNVYIPGTASIGVANVSNDVQFEVQGNSQFNSDVNVDGSLYVLGGYQIPMLGGYIINVNSSGQYSYIPLVASTSSIIPNDTYIMLYPGFKIVLYTGSNFTGSSYAYDNSTGTSSIKTSSSTLYGSSSSIQSYYLYFNEVIINQIN